MIYHGVYRTSTVMSLLTVIWYAYNDDTHHGETNNRDIRNVFLVGCAITILKNMKVNGKKQIYYGK
jgi:hypothetical protein